MNKKIFALIMVILSMLSLASIASAQEPITAWTDKSEYSPGETGTLYIVFFNGEDFTVTIEEIIIVFQNWQAYQNDEWKGNQTLEINQGVVSNRTHEMKTTFTVPTDGRAISTSVSIRVETTELGNIYDYPSIMVAETPKYMEQIVTVFTIQVVLIIVCTIIIAATIFLSARRPQITWQKEEKQE